MMKEYEGQQWLRHRRLRASSSRPQSAEKTCGLQLLDAEDVLGLNPKTFFC